MSASGSLYLFSRAIRVTLFGLLIALPPCALPQDATTAPAAQASSHQAASNDQRRAAAAFNNAFADLSDLRASKVISPDSAHLVKDGFACLSNFCIGDGPDSLQGNFEPAPSLDDALTLLPAGTSPFATGQGPGPAAGARSLVSSGSESYPSAARAIAQRLRASTMTRDGKSTTSLFDQALVAFERQLRAGTEPSALSATADLQQLRVQAITLDNAGKWPAAARPVPTGPQWLEAMQSNYAAVYRAMNYAKALYSDQQLAVTLAPYFATGAFDGSFLELTRGRTPHPLECPPPVTLIGRFTSESGYPTQVTITPSTQGTFVISKIQRHFKSALVGAASDDPLVQQDEFSHKLTQQIASSYGPAFEKQLGDSNIVVVNVDNEVRISRKYSGHLLLVVLHHGIANDLSLFGPDPADATEARCKTRTASPLN